jgi:hypothetical protein
MQLSHFGRAGLLAGALVGGALLLSACGSSTTTPPTSTAGGGATTTTAGGGGATTTTTGGATTTTAAGGGGGLSALASSLQTGQTRTYDAVYKATESSGTSETVEYAAVPPSEFAVIVTSSSGVGEYIETTGHAYACNQKTSGGAWTCIDFGAAGLGAYADLVQIYQGKYWYTDVEAIKSYSGLAGFKVSNSSMSVAGQSLQCVTWSGGPAAETTAGSGGEVCVTSTGVLGYVHAGTSTFELTSYSTAVSGSKFQTPAGATITQMSSIP